MKASQFFASAAIGLLAISSSCQHSSGEEEPCPSQEIAGTTPQLWPCRTDRSTTAQVFVINSAIEYSNAFMCSSTLPSQVDFSKNTLLVGWKNYCCCGHVKSQRLLYSCSPKTYTYQVEIEAGTCGTALPVASMLLVPKLPAGARVVIDMQ